MNADQLRKHLIEILADDPEIAEVAECEDEGEVYLEITDTDGDKHALDLGAVDDDEDLDDDEEDDEDD